MQEGIHPNYNDIDVVCACGNVIKTATTVESLHVDICSACHPFYTGQQKIMDTEGRVDRFNKKWAKTKDILEKKKQKGPRAVTVS